MTLNPRALYFIINTMYAIRMKPTPLELRKRIVAARYFDGQSMGQIAERFKIPKATVQNILRRYDLANTVEPKPQNAGRKPAITGACLKKLEQQVAKHPDATLAELREDCGITVSVVAVHNTLKRLGFTRKKSLYTRASSAART